MNLLSLFDDLLHEMSEFQDDYFVTTKAGITPYGQYKQSLRESHSRYYNLLSIFLDIKECELDIENLDKEDIKYNIDLARKHIQLQTLNTRYNTTLRQFVRFYQQAKELKKYVGDLTPEKTYALEHEMFIEKLKETLFFNIKSSGRVTQEALDFLFSFPKEDREHFQKILSSPQEVNNFILEMEKRNTYILPDNMGLLDIEPFKDKLEVSFSTFLSLPQKGLEWN